jgi:alpha-galactosidase
VKWTFDTDEELYVLGDAWERSYGDLCFLKLSDNSRTMPWYFAATDKTETYCFGVKTQPEAFVGFTYDRSGITAKIDCRNGGSGVKLCGKSVSLCTFVFEHYRLPPFESLCEYCRVLCDNPLLSGEKIYGGNNWYYAYGESSFEEIESDAALQAELAQGIAEKPFMVVDDGWEVNSCKGPYEPNEKFRDMKALAGRIKSAGARPGIWVRLLDNLSSDITPDMRIMRGGKREYLDPTDERVKSLIKNDIEKIKGWGYELLKHDFSTVDLFGDYGLRLPDTITNYDDWHFRDETRTNAQIVLDLYRLIREACGDMLIIGCNTVSHLCAGLVHMNRTGDDTSGREWERTRKMGVNTLAFRLAQNKAFYLVDADCVGIIGDSIPWEKNRQWLDLLSKSDTALFVSCASVSDEQRSDLAKAYLEAQKDHEIKPVDIYENPVPSEWIINGKKVNYSWF